MPQVYNYAVLGNCRLGATRLGYHAPTLYVTINGTDRTRFVSRYESEINDRAGAAANTATVMVRGFTPTLGQTITIYSGTTRGVLEFSGEITAIEQVQRRFGTRLRYRLTCTDWTVLLDRRLVFQGWTATSMSTILAAIISAWTSGFTSTGVQASLAAIDLTAVREYPTRVIQRIADIGSGIWKMLYTKDLYFATSGGWTNPLTRCNPADLTTANTHFRDLRRTTTIPDRNRIYVQGASRRVVASASGPGVAIPAGFTILPLDDVSIFSASGGTVVTGTQELTYTGKAVLAAPTAPSAAQVTGGRATLNLTRSGSTVTALDANARLRGAISGTLTRSGTTATMTTTGGGFAGLIGGFGVRIFNVTNDTNWNATWPNITLVDLNTITFTVPNTLTSPATSGGNISFDGPQFPYAAGDSITISGADQPEYNGIFVIATPVDGQFTYTVSGTPASPATGTIYAWLDASGKVETGSFTYETTLLSADGETVGSTASSTASIAAVTTPGALSAPAQAVDGSNQYTSGNMPAATNGWLYKVGFITSQGRTLPGTASAAASVAALTLPTAPSVAATTGGSLAASTYSYTVAFVDATGFETQLSPFVSVVVGGPNNAVNVTNIPQGLGQNGATRVLKRILYRATNAGGLFFPFGTMTKVTTLNDNTTTTFTDTLADASLGAAWPSTGTYQFGTGQISLTGIPTASDQRVIARVLYRTSLYGSTYKVLTVINDNSTTTYTDNIADSALGEQASTVDTSGGGQMRVTAIATSTDLRVTKRRVYRQAATGALGYRLVKELADNTTTAFTDNTATADLATSAQPPAVGTIVGLTGVTGAVTAVSPGDTVQISVKREDTGAQTTLAAAEGGDGIHEYLILDDSLTSVEACNARGDAELALGKVTADHVTYTTEDEAAAAGAQITINISGISTTLPIREVRIYWIPGRKKPQRDVIAALPFTTLAEYLANLQDQAA